METTQTKVCPCCGVEQCLEEFYTDGTKASGRQSHCKACVLEKSRRYYARNRERRLAYQRARRVPRPRTPGARRHFKARPCVICGGAFVPLNGRHRHCESCGSVRRRELAARQVAARRRKREVARLLRVAAHLAAWAPPVLPPLLPRAPAPAPRHPRMLRLNLRGATGAYIASLKLDPCAYCGGPGGQRDHIVPRAVAGGETGGKSTRDIDNLTGACANCNAKKSDESLLAFLL